MLDGINVDYYDTPTPLKQLANISVEEGRTLVVTPFDKSLMQKLEKAILKSNLGLNPSTTGDIIRLPLPPLTEETRKELAKGARASAENGRVAVRNIRRDANSDFKELLKEKEISEDEEHKAEDGMQKLTDQYIALIEDMLKSKETDLMSI